jgi:hypothetical protein
MRSRIISFLLVLLMVAFGGCSSARRDARRQVENLALGLPWGQTLKFDKDLLALLTSHYGATAQD